VWEVMTKSNRMKKSLTIYTALAGLCFLFDV
jgi:hypothetical protein